MMKMLQGAVLVAVSLLFAVPCAAEESTLPYRFADSQEGAELLLANRDYYENLTQNDLNYRMQKMDAALEELEHFAAEQTLDFTAEEKAAIDREMDAVRRLCDERGYALPPTEGIVFVKTTMQEECDAGAYTHGTEIYLGQRLLDQALGGGLQQRYFREVLAHELFHCLTRNHPDFREEMYRILGFTVVPEDFDFPETIKNRIISNPDVGHHNSYASFEINGEMRDCAVIFTTARPFGKPGDNFFDEMVTGLVPIDDLSVMYTADEASNFYEIFGRNTYYVIDPEETLADNFAMAVVYGPDGKAYQTPELIEAIDAYLRERAAPAAAA